MKITIESGDSSKTQPIESCQEVGGLAVHDKDGLLAVFARKKPDEEEINVKFIVKNQLGVGQNLETKPQTLTLEEPIEYTYANITARAILIP